MEQLSQNQSIEIDGVKPPEVLEAKTDTEPALAAYKSQPENNPLSQAFMEKYGVEYSDPQVLAEDPARQKPETSIVIPVRNEGDGVLGLLETLSVQARANNAEIVLVINNDTAGTHEQIELAIADGRLDESVLRIVECSYETKEQDGIKVGGVGLARKIGMDYAVISGAESIVSLDADCGIEADFLEKISEKSRSGVDGLTYEIVPVAKDASGEKYLDTLKKIREYRAAKGIKREWTPSTGDPVTGAVHVVSTETYAMAGGMSTAATGEDGRFGEKVAKTGAKISESGARVFFDLRESDTPKGMGAAYKEYNETQMVENPDNPAEKMNIDEAISKMENDQEFLNLQERERKIKEILKDLVQELTIFFNSNKEKLQTVEFEDIVLIKEEANNSPLISKYLLSSEDDFTQLIGTLKDSGTADQFLSALRDKLGDEVRERIEESVSL